MLDKINQIVNSGIEKKMLQQATQNESLNGAQIRVTDRDLIHFGSCSYLGLEFHPQLRKGVSHAAQTYGTQFSSSRAYLSLGLYEELEAKLEKLFGQPVIATASTTLGTMATLPVVVQEGDAVIMDFLVHSSIQTAAQLLKARNIPLHYIPHNSIDHLETKIKSLRGKHKRIWYFADGVYSMHGDYAPLKEIEVLLNTYKQFHLFIDDAHGMSWTGNRGMGYVRSQIEHHEKMVMVTSLNKAVAAGGGVVVLPNEKMKQDVRNCGGTLVFSGPIQPPMLGAAIASLDLHLSPEFGSYQSELRERIAFANQKLQGLGLPQQTVNDSPLFFIPCGLPKVARTIIARMMDQGFYLNAAGFPAVPMKKSGLRFTITRNHTLEHIDEMLTTLAREYRLGLQETGTSPQEVSRIFKIPAFQLSIQEQVSETAIIPLESLQEEVFTQVDEIPADEWDQLFKGRGSLLHHNLKALEHIFTHRPEVENNWKFYYLLVKDREKKTVLATHFTVALLMDDMLAKPEISRKVMAIRKEQPYYLTSKAVISGTMFTKGESVWVDLEHPQWRQAMEKMVKLMQQIAEEENASKVMVREFSQVQNEQIRDYMLDLGLVEQKLPDNFMVENLSWKNRDDYLAGMGQRYRYSLRKEMLPYEDKFIVEAGKPNSIAERRKCFELYQNVQEKARDISVFQLPFEVFEHMHDNEHYDIIRMYLKEDPGNLVAVMYSYLNHGEYNALVVGLDYDYVRELNSYKQILFQTVLRARELDCKRLDLAYTAEIEKKKVGARPREVYAFTMAMEHYSFALLESFG